MSDWQKALHSSVDTLDKLAEKFGRDVIDVEALQPAFDNFQMRITQNSLDTIKEIGDPMWQQYIPTTAELDIIDGVIDSLDEDGDSPVPNITHRYPDRVLFLVSPICASYCRFCTRRRKVGDPEKIPLNQYDSAFAYIAEHPEIRDVILSGGDPMMLSDRRLEYIFQKLREIPHIEIIRLGSRITSHLPARITPEFCEMVKKYHPVYMNTHFNHPAELTPDTVAALGRLADAGVPLGCQTVLLRGVNDDPMIMKDLMQKLLKARVRPYYIYMADQVAGGEHFRTTVEKGLEIVKALRGWTSGLAVPHFVIDAPGGGGKVPLLPEYVEEINEDEVIFRNYEGQRFVYKQPRQPAIAASACGDAAAAESDIVPIQTGKKTRTRASSSKKGRRAKEKDRHLIRNAKSETAHQSKAGVLFSFPRPLTPRSERCTLPAPLRLPVLMIALPERFELDREIGRGGMAVVYRAYDRHLGRFIAIKVLSPDLSNTVGAERFQREISLTAKLVHPGIVALFDSGEASGQLYYVMPLVSGETLRSRVTRERRMVPQDCAALGADVAEALAYAHGMGIVHRDVKPENIFAVAGRAVLADFGIARMAADPASDRAEETMLTSNGIVLGTVSYMSPEQASGDPDIDGRSDLYSLGCVLYELLTGSPPFAGPNPMAILARHIKEPVRSPRENGFPVPRDIEMLLLQLLAKAPEDRPASAADVARILRASSIVSSTTAAIAQPTRSAPAQSTSDAAPITEADRLVLEGLRAFNMFGPTGGAAARSHLDESFAYLTRALALDPHHARGLCAMGNWHYVAGFSGIAPRAESIVRGRELIFSALAADDRCAEVHCSLCKLALYSDDEFHAATRHIRRAVELAPTEPEALRLSSIVYKILGRPTDAVDAARSAIERVPESAPLWNAFGDALLAAGRNAEAVDALKHAITLLPRYGPALERLELARTRLGDLDLALDLRISRLRLSGERERSELLRQDGESVGAQDAIRRDVRRELDGLLRGAESADPFAEYWRRNAGDRIVSGHGELGEWREAMNWVERSYDERPGRLRRMLADLPIDYRGLAIDPRYARLMRVAGLEDMI